MSEWWSYRLGDFLLFSPRTYWRLVESYNRELWPAHLVAAVIAVILLVSMRRGWYRLACIMLGLCWGFIAWQWDLARYASINWAAKWLGAAHLLEALLLLSFIPRPTVGDPSKPARRAAMSVSLVAFVAYPMIAPLSARSWLAAETFALHSDPTAIVTSGVAVLFYGGRAWPLLIVPVASSMISGATLLAMSERFAIVPGLAVIVAVALVAAIRRGTRHP